MRGNTARILLPALVVLGLVGIVAIASTGSTSRGTNAARAPSATLLDTILSLGLVAVLVGAGLFIYALTQAKSIRRELERRRQRARFVSFVALMAIFTLLTYFRMRDSDVNPSVAEPPVPVPAPETPRTDASATYEPEFAWGPVIVVLALAVSAVVAYVVAVRRARGAEVTHDALAEQLAVVFDDTLDDLRAESDPRRAVIAAYARMERVLAAHSIPRRKDETPREYLGRILGGLAIDVAAVRRLTDLFSRAKFSQHAVDVGMKEEAIEALEHVRDDLRNVAAERDAAAAAELVATEPSP